MWKKIQAISWNAIYRTYTDRTAFILMFIIPIALSLVMGLAFGTSDDDINIVESTILVVNNDTGITVNNSDFNWGQQIFVNILVENTPDGLAELINGEISTNIDEARQKVEDGDARAVVIIPANFSENIANNASIEVVLYYNPSSQVGSTVVISVLERLVANLNSGQVGETVLFEIDNGYIIEIAADSNRIDDIATIATTEIPMLYQIQPESIISLNRVNVEGEAEEFDALKFFAPAMAVLFMTFTMASGTRGILEEQQDGTLQRIATTPTPRWVYMAGKMLGTYTSGIIQMAILLIVTPFMALMLGSDTAVWGDNYIGVILITLTVVGAGTGLGLLLASLSKSPTEANNLRQQ